MRLISRALLLELVGPFFLGFAAYTFILLIRTILFLADFAVRRSASFVDVAKLAVLSLPWMVVLTIPMAFLLAVLVGLGRLGADSELIALRSCGVGSASLYRPVLGAAAVLSLGVLFLYNVVLPPANTLLERSMARLAATSIVNVVAPRTFREPRPGVTLFFDRTAPDGRSFEGIFLILGEAAEAPNRVIVARRGTLALEGDQLWLDLFESTVHEVDPEDSSRYRISRNESQRLLLAGEFGGTPLGRVSAERGIRSQALRQLWRTAHEAPNVGTRRTALVELNKKFAIPFACFAFALVGVPLADSFRRGGRGASFALSLGIIVVYYVFLTTGETWAQQGKVSPGLAMWAANLFLLAIGALAALRPRSWRAPIPRRPAREIPREKGAAAAPTASRPSPSPRAALRIASACDRYVLARFFSALLLVFASALVLAVVVDYADKVDEIAKNHPSSQAILGYYRYFLFSIGMQIAPFAVLLATLIGLGVLSKNNEDTAFRASGVSLQRLSAPVLLVAAAGALAAFALSEYLLPFAEQRQTHYKNQIYGHETGGKGVGSQNWYLASNGEIWHREEGNASQNTLYSVSVFQFDSGFHLVRRTAAREASWAGQSWLLRQGWSRDFGDEEPVGFRPFLEQHVAGDPPQAVSAVRRRPEEMRFRELEHLTQRLRAGGYPTGSLETALQTKVAQPAMLPIMALLAAPFAFRVGRRGALAGIGLGLILGILALIAAAFLTKLGDVGALPPALAAWSPNVLFGLAALYFLLRMRT
ncbi:MAG TPA: LPS export ABC transporter permease LptG [Thermoanaerobaculia bacterium]|jgi:LPS export ABC transporter permease LptG/LPS export ABC transporter permease LptF